MNTSQTALTGSADQCAGETAAAESAARTRQQTLAQLIHELTTPLHGMLGLTGLLLSATDLSPDHRRKLALIEECGAQQQRLINDILDLSRLDARMLRVHKSVTSLRPLVQSVVDAITPQAKAGHVTLSVYMSEAVPQSAYVDALRLRQVLDNLLSNALKFSEHRSVRLEVDLVDSALLLPHVPHELRFSVKDTGRGMTHAQLASIGRLFERGADEASLPLGHGIGLFVTRELITLMGGDLRLTSTLGHGTTATFALPLH